MTHLAYQYKKVITCQIISLTGRPWYKTALTYQITKYTSDLRQYEIRSEIARAFRVWSAVTPLTFKEVASNADIVILFATGDHGDGFTFDGPRGVQAHAHMPYNGGRQAHEGDTHFDDAEEWTVRTKRGKIDKIYSRELWIRKCFFFRILTGP